MIRAEYAPGRRHRRHEGVSDEQVEHILRELPVPRDEEE